jgi:hypothetical protein
MRCATSVAGCKNGGTVAFFLLAMVAATLLVSACGSGLDPPACYKADRSSKGPRALVVAPCG